MINQAEIIRQIGQELTVAYLAAGRKAPEDALVIVAGSLAENIPFQSVKQVHEVFARAKDIEAIPTQKTLKECWKNYGEEVLKYSGDASGAREIEYENPCGSWLPKEAIRRKVNVRLAIDRYSIALGDTMYQRDIKAHRLTLANSADKKYEYLNQDAANAFDAQAMEHIQHLYRKYWRGLEMAQGYPADAPLSLELIPPTVNEFRTMLQKEGNI